MLTKSDLNQSLGEESEFPSLCETCLGPNPYIRMTKQNRGAECKVCTRPFTVFRWNPGAGMRFKKTEDLQFGLPIQVRDAALQQKSLAPSSDINREYFAQNIEASGQLEGATSSKFGKSNATGREILKSLARQDPNYKRNRPHICTFFVKGTCNRGSECPYRHEMPAENEMKHQSIQDRYHGRNDPVARRILNDQASSVGLAPPEDKSIISLFLTSLAPDTSEDSIRSYFDKIPIKSVVLVTKTACAFVNFTNRGAAEEGARRAAVGIRINDKDVKVQWGRSRPSQSSSSAKKIESVPESASASAVAST